jgi:hypothetical protein
LSGEPPALRQDRSSGTILALKALRAMLERRAARRKA